ncbi:MAG: DNA base-flipping protein [Halieaceae bacterium]|nr:MAG: DNA base-flipping protein [Halieaceae bacterium]
MTSHEPDRPQERLLLTVNSIPAGKVSSFGRIAAASGYPRRARWVGRILGQLPSDTTVPWHRVLGHDGTITCPRAELAKRRLRAEGIRVKGLKVNMNEFGWPV